MSTRSVVLALIATAALLAPAGLSAPAQAHDHGRVSVGIGVGPFYPAPYAPPYPRYGYSHYYYPPAVVYPAPPPVIIAPPRVVYTQPPALIPAPNADSAQCREYQAKVMINGKPQNSYGTACRQPDGTWKIIN